MAAKNLVYYSFITCTEVCKKPKARPYLMGKP